MSCFLCLAKYYGALPFIANTIKNMLLTRRDFWKEVAERPEALYALAT